MRNTIGLLLLLAATAVGAQSLNRCLDESGRTTYSDRPCPSSAKSSQLRTTDNIADFSFEKRAAQRLKEQQENEVAHAEARAESARPRLECDEALAKYKALFKERGGADVPVAQKYSATGISLTPEAVEVRAKCGEGAIPVPEIVVRPIIRTEAGIYRPMGAGYLSPKGEFCRPVTGGLQCKSGFVRIFN